MSFTTCCTVMSTGVLVARNVIEISAAPRIDGNGAGVCADDSWACGFADFDVGSRQALAEHVQDQEARVVHARLAESDQAG